MQREFADALSCVGEAEKLPRSLLPRSPAVPAVWGTADVSTQKDMGSSVKIVSSLADKCCPPTPALIRVLWLMFDEEGDRLRACYRRVFTPASCATPPTTKREVVFFLAIRVSGPPPLVFTPPTLTVPYPRQGFGFFFSLNCKSCFSMFLPAGVVSTLTKGKQR